MDLKAPTHYVRLYSEVKNNLRLWATLLTEFNGKSFFLDDWKERDTNFLELSPIVVGVEG